MATTPGDSAKTASFSIRGLRVEDTAFDEPLDPFVIHRLLATPAMATLDADRFPASRSLESILSHDARTVRFQNGDIVVREGDYGSSVFVILSGTVRVLLDREASRSLVGRRRVKRGSLWRSLRVQLRRPRSPEVRTVASLQPPDTMALRRAGDAARMSIQDVAGVIERHRTVTLGAGEMFGEIAALTRSPRTATLFAEGEVEAVEIRWQGLREIRRRDPAFRASLDELYRSRNLAGHLKECAVLAGLDDATLDLLARHTTFEDHGDLEWHQVFKSFRDAEDASIVQHEPVIAEEGHYADGLIVIRSGFARVSRRLDHGQRTIGYLTANEVYGLDELRQSEASGAAPRWSASLRAVGHVDALRIPTNLVLEHVLPHLGPGDDSLSPTPSETADTPAWATRPAEGELEQSLLDALVDRRVINGQAAMIINSDRCVGCDDCVNACAVTHDGNPRFVRHGASHAQLMFTTACMHCVDPVCLIGCPTGAIHRPQQDIRVLIDDATCIGCGTCADSCPYDNIRMVEARTPRGGFLYDQETQLPILKATKCDLCSGQPGGPACARACPHDALVRVDLRDRRDLARWVRGSGRTARRLAMGLAAAVGAGAIWGLDRIWDGTLRRPEVLSGWMLLTLLAVLVVFAARKRLPGLPLGQASNWLRVHTVVGLIAAAGFGVHAGMALPAGWFNAGLWLLFLVVAASGVVGLVVSRTTPRRLARHGERVLFERIPGLRRKLAEEVEELSMRSVHETASATLASYYTQRLAPFLAGPRNLVAHLFDSNRPWLRLRDEMRHLSRYLDDRGRELLAEIEELVAAKDGLDHQYALNLLLRGWKFLHGPMTWALVGLVVVHVVVTLAFSGGTP